MEAVVHDGWLVKSPPEKRIFKAKWRQRWFVLRHSGHLPGQFILEYFTDNSCKKLKGRIDLDQCEQVDAGLTFESKKTSYQYMFDVRTPKRTYYLVAETEADMNKWVECICSVCGLKIHVEEDFLVPQDNVTITTSPGNSTNLTEAKSSSNLYIPISECHTGKPVLNGNAIPSESVNDFPKVPPPPPPSVIEWNSFEQTVPDEFYDHPKPLTHNNIDSQQAISGTDTCDSDKVPIHFRSESEPVALNDVFSTLPSKAAWNLSLDETVPINSSTMPRQKTSSKTELPEYDIVPPFHGSIKDIKTVKNVQSLTDHFEKISVKSPSEISHNDIQESNTNYVNDIKIPPRPPKPSKLRDRPRYENFELPHQISKGDKNIYDIPPPSKGSVNSKQISHQASMLLKNESDNDLSPSTKVPLSTSTGNESKLDEIYDFPKFRSEDNINATVPLVPAATSTGTRPRRHAYTNAPPGLFNSKDLIFNYEYRPSLMTSDSYSGSDAFDSFYSSNDTATPPSPSAIGAYANVPTSPTASANFQSDMPPAVNRDLKPKRVPSNEEKGSFSFLTLQPPPVCRSKSKTSKSFRKPRAAPSPIPNVNGMPPVPNRFRQPDISATSDDEMSNSSGSRRNSSNDEQAKMFAPISKKDEIQYLDLDLESETSPSPKSPERMSASTVYKKVDFVKTKAFNEMRQNVEENYRKSQ